MIIQRNSRSPVTAPKTTPTPHPGDLKIEYPRSQCARLYTAIGLSRLTKRYWTRRLFLSHLPITAFIEAHGFWPAIRLPSPIAKSSCLRPASAPGRRRRPAALSRQQCFRQLERSRRPAPALPGQRLPQPRYSAAYSETIKQHVFFGRAISGRGRGPGRRRPKSVQLPDPVHQHDACEVGMSKFAPLPATTQHIRPLYFPN